jgi:hypothetical protein
MRTLRYLFVIALLCTLARVARADDFQFIIADPIVPLDVVEPVFTDDFALTFSSAGCQPGQLPSGVTGYDDCFTGINLTGAPLTSLQIEFPVFTNPYTGLPDTPSCPTLSSGDEFSDITCGLTNGGADYLLSFSGGDIPTATVFNTLCIPDPFAPGGGACISSAIFTIAIGIPTPPGDTTLPPTVLDEDISTDVGTAAVLGNTPEPSSFLLMSTGVLSLGLFGACQRRRTPLAARSSNPPNLN